MKILVRETIADAGVQLLRDKFEVDVDQESPLAEIIGGYDAIVIRSATKLTADLIAAGTKLRVIGRQAGSEAQRAVVLPAPAQMPGVKPRACSAERRRQQT